MLSKKELEDLRPWVADNVTKVLGFSETTVVSTAIDCIGRNLSRQATTGKKCYSFYLKHTIDFTLLCMIKWWHIGDVLSTYCYHRLHIPHTDSSTHEQCKGACMYMYTRAMQGCMHVILTCQTIFYTGTCLYVHT